MTLEPELKADNQEITTKFILNFYFIYHKFIFYILWFETDKKKDDTWLQGIWSFDIK